MPLYLSRYFYLPERTETKEKGGRIDLTAVIMIKTTIEAKNVFQNQTEKCSGDKLDCAIISSHIKGKQSTQRK